MLLPQIFGCLLYVIQVFEYLLLQKGEVSMLILQKGFRFHSLIQPLSIAQSLDTHFLHYFTIADIKVYSLSNYP